MSLFSKINVTDIVKDHFKTWRNFETGRAMLGDWALFLGFPMVVAAVVLATGTHIGDLGTLLTAVAIVTGLLFALLILVLEIAITTAERVETDGSTPRRRQRVEVLRDLKANVAYAVLISVLTAIVLAAGDMIGPALVAERVGGQPVQVARFSGAFSALIAYILTHFGLTLLMVLKRMYRLLDRELDTVETEPFSR